MLPFINMIPLRLPQVLWKFGPLRAKIARRMLDSKDKDLAGLYGLGRSSVTRSKRLNSLSCQREREN